MGIGAGSISIPATLVDWIKHPNHEWMQTKRSRKGNFNQRSQRGTAATVVDFF
jgi:hypothetical protein